MKNSLLITIIVIAVVIIAVVVGFIIMQYPVVTPTPNPSPNPTPSPNPSPNPTPNPSTPQTYNVVISGFAFSPASLSIKAGDTVIWTNQDSAPHTVTSDPSISVLNSATLANGAIYSHKFTSAGTFNYHCTIHPNMKASVTVE